MIETDEIALTSDMIPEALVFGDSKRSVYAAKAENKNCPKCGRFSEVWTFILNPIHQHPNCLVVHRGEDSCGWRSSTIDLFKPDGWTIKEQNH